MNTKKVGLNIGLAAIGVGLIVVVLILFQAFGSNDDQNYQVIQSLHGNVTVRDQAGMYFQGASTVWTYPRSVQRYFSASKEEGGSKDESIRVTFNDGGTAQVSTMIRFQLPTTEEKRRLVHREFSGSVENVTQAVRSHLINCCKATAPLMSASEHQSARKAEFTQLVHEQLTKGLYKMKKVERELSDRKDDEGNPIKVFATEVVVDPETNMPVIAQTSPLQEYGLSVMQFSITGTDYDGATLKQFEAKKASFLAAEKSKAEREQEIQQRLMIEERGKREKAEVEAVALKEKAAAVIKADQEAQVATIEAKKKADVAAQKKQQSEIEANERLSVAKIAKQEAETKAAENLAVAELQRKAAEEEAKKIQVLAAAREKAIQLGGDITEKEKVALEIQKEQTIGVAKAWADGLSKTQFPKVVISGGGGSNGGSSIEALLQMWLLQQVDKDKMLTSK